MYYIVFNKQNKLEKHLVDIFIWHLLAEICLSSHF